MPQPLVDLSKLNLTEEVMTQAEIRRLIPHDHEFRLIDGVCFLDPEENVIVAYKDWGANPWWARGHIPGRPLMPGVLMIEGCAQAASILMKTTTEGWGPDRFVGMGGVDDARFRGVVTPPCRIHFVSKTAVQTRRLARYPAQAFVNGKLVFEMELIGVPL